MSKIIDGIAKDLKVIPELRECHSMSLKMKKSL